MIQNKYRVKNKIKCKDCVDNEIKLSINRFKCNSCASILCREHYKLGLIAGNKYYKDNSNYCMCILCDYMYNR